VMSLLSVLEPAWNYNGPIELEFPGCEFMSAEGVAILAGLAYYRSSKSAPVSLEIHSINRLVSRNLRKMGFTELFDREYCISNENSIPLYHDDGKNLDGVITYLEQQVMSRSQMPQMTPSLHKEIRKSFAEIFGNIARHSDSPIGGLVCGQIYPRQKEIQLTFFDSGVGICKRVRSSYPSIENDRAAIYWAVQKGNSTLAQEEGPRGLGLYLLREFLKANGGALHIYANRAYYKEHESKREQEFLSQELPGTLLDLRIRIDPSSVYEFANE
jgi:hypothetical protein